MINTKFVKKIPFPYHFVVTQGSKFLKTSYKMETWATSIFRRLLTFTRHFPFPCHIYSVEYHFVTF